MSARLLALVVLCCACGSTTADSTPADDQRTEFIAPEERCDVDADCVITDFPGCCACCGCSNPYAIRGDALETQRAECASVDCERAQEDLGCAVEECVGCPSDDRDFAALCRGGRCVRDPS